MREWIAFQYREFYDVPRVLILTFKGKTLLLESLFDENEDEYSTKYTVYEMPTSILNELNGSWVELNRQAISSLGEIPVDSIVFDSTKRKQLDGKVLETLNL